MREIRLSGSMRGRHGHGLVVAENQTCLPTLSGPDVVYGLHARYAGVREALPHA
jgi:hypothetical protein